MSDNDETPKDAQLPAREIAKVVNNFINKISKGAGIFYAPTHTKRMAKADAKARYAPRWPRLSFITLRALAGHFDLSSVRGYDRVLADYRLDYRDGFI